MPSKSQCIVCTCVLDPDSLHPDLYQDFVGESGSRSSFWWPIIQFNFIAAKSFTFSKKMWTIFILRPLCKALNYSWETSPAPQREQHPPLKNIKFLHFTPLFCGPRSETLVYSTLNTFIQKCAHSNINLIWYEKDLILRTSIHEDSENINP